MAHLVGPFGLCILFLLFLLSSFSSAYSHRRNDPGPPPTNPPPDKSTTTFDLLNVINAEITGSLGALTRPSKSAKYFEVYFDDGSTLGAMGNGAAEYENRTLNEWKAISTVNLTLSLVRSKLFTSTKFLSLLLAETEATDQKIDGHFTYLDASGALVYNYRQFYYHMLKNNSTFPKYPENDDIALIIAKKNLHLSTKARLIYQQLMRDFLSEEFRLACNLMMNETIDPTGCIAYWDGTACWPTASAGETLGRYCPPYVAGFYVQQHITMRCSANGIWPLEANYSRCLLPVAKTEPLQLEDRAFKRVQETLTNEKIANVDLFFKFADHATHFMGIAVWGNLCSLVALVLVIYVFSFSRYSYSLMTSSFKNRLHFQTFIAFLGRVIFQLFGLLIFTNITLDLSPNRAVHKAVINILDTWKAQLGFNASHAPGAPSRIMDLIERSTSKADAFTSAMEDLVYRLPNITGLDDFGLPKIYGELPYPIWACSANNLLWSYFTLATYCWLSLEAYILMRLLLWPFLPDMSMKPLRWIGWTFPLPFILTRILLHWFMTNSQACWVLEELGLLWTSLLRDVPITLNVIVVISCYINTVYILGKKTFTHLAPHRPNEVTTIRRFFYSAFYLALVLGVYQVLLIGLTVYAQFTRNWNKSAILVFEYFSVLVQSSQGLAVAMLFGLWTNAVRKEIDFRWPHCLWLWHRFAPLPRLFFSSTTTTHSSLSKNSKTSNSGSTSGTGGSSSSNREYTSTGYTSDTNPAAYTTDSSHHHISHSLARAVLLDSVTESPSPDSYDGGQSDSPTLEMDALKPKNSLAAATATATGSAAGSVLSMSSFGENLENIAMVDEARGEEETEEAEAHLTPVVIIRKFRDREGVAVDRIRY